MKLNLNTLASQNTRDSAANNISTAFSFSGLGNLQTEVQNNPTSALFTDSTGAINNTPTEPGFSLSFTDAETYNLDDIIFKKRRDNADCPLIVKVIDNDATDDAIIKLITTLILSDYGVSYTDENYKEQIKYVPLFEEVFTSYFNTYYEIYDRQRTEYYEGSISLTSILEEIGQYHDNLAKSFTGEETRTYANSDSYNKPKVEWEFGSSYSNALTEDISDYIPTILEQFSLKIINGILYIAYNGTLIQTSGVTIGEIGSGSTPSTGIDTRIETTYKFITYPLDIAPYAGPDSFNPVRIVQFKKKIRNLFTSTTTHFDLVEA